MEVGHIGQFEHDFTGSAADNGTFGDSGMLSNFELTVRPDLISFDRGAISYLVQPHIELITTVLRNPAEAVSLPVS